MPQQWQAKISDPKERKVFEALSDPSWNYRTVAGISKSTGLPEFDVEAIVVKYPQFVRESTVRDPKGRKLFSLHSRSIVVIPGFKEIDLSVIEEALFKIRTYITKSIR